MSDRDILIEDGLSYFNGTTIKDVQDHPDGHEVTGYNLVQLKQSYPMYNVILG